ncbi:MAG TPA: DUF302 domain-containing protein [Candidatus Tumulicola sp.]|jgi:uncharacterized protein (DUF302 family)
MQDNSHDGKAVEYPSALTFAETVDRLRNAITHAGLRIFAEIDHAGGAAEAGLHMDPSMVLIYGSPAGGTPAMQAVPVAALDLPLRVLIRQRPDGAVVIAFHPAEAMLRDDGVPTEIAARLSRAQELLVNAIAPK